MSQISKRYISKDVSDRIFDLFIKTLLNVKNRNVAENFTRDLFSSTEQIMITKRLSIALLLEKGYDQRTISEILKVSTSTVSHINNTVKNSSDEYKQLIKELLSEESITDFLHSIALLIVELPSKGGEGSGVWRATKKKLEKEKNPF